MLQRIIFLMALAITVQANGVNSWKSFWGATDSSTTDTHQTQQPRQPVQSTTANVQPSSVGQQPAAPVVVVKPADQGWVMNLFKQKSEEPVKQSINYARLPAEERMKLMTPEEQEKLRIFEADQASIREENAKIKEEKQARKLQWAGEQIKNKTLAAEGADLIAALRGEEPPSSIYRRMQNDVSTVDKLIQGDLQKQNETVPLKPVEPQITPEEKIKQEEEKLKQEEAPFQRNEGSEVIEKKVEQVQIHSSIDAGINLIQNQNQFGLLDRVKTDLADLKKYNENPEAFTDQKRIDELKVWSEVAAKLGDDPEKAKDFFGTLKMSERLNNMVTDPNQPFARAALNREHKKLAGMLDGDTALLARVVPHDIQLSQKEQKASNEPLQQLGVNQQDPVQATQRAFDSFTEMAARAPENYQKGLKIYRDRQNIDKAARQAQKKFAKTGTIEDWRAFNALDKRLDESNQKLSELRWGEKILSEQHQKDVSKIRNRVIVGGVMATMMVAAIIWAATASTASQKSGGVSNSVTDDDQRVAGETSFATVLDEGYLAPSAQQPDGQYAIHPLIAMISDQKLFGRTLTGDEQSSLSQQFNLIVTQTGNAGTLATKAMQDGRDLTADEAKKMLDYKNIVEQAEKQFFIIELDIRYPCGPHDGVYDVVADYQACLTALQSQTVDIKKQLNGPTTGDGALSDAKRGMLEAAAENIITEQFYLNKRMVLEREARDKFAELSQNKDLSQDQKDSQFQNYYQLARQANTALIVGDGQFIARQINEPFERSRNRRVPVLLGNEDPMPYTFVEPVPSAP